MASGRPLAATRAATAAPAGESHQASSGDVSRPDADDTPRWPAFPTPSSTTETGAASAW